jgi:uncharacterized coiled-coil protein SlyX
MKTKQLREVILEVLSESASVMKNRIKELEQKIQKEIWRIQMIDYPTPNTNNELHKMQKELKDLKNKINKVNKMNEGASVIKVKNKGSYITMGSSYGGGDKRERYDVYLNGEAVYEFTNTAFRQKSIEQIAKILLDTPSLEISQEDSIRMATEMSKYLSK